MAQGAFTIRSPKSGATVRETVAVRIPRNAVPDNGYIGFFVNGKFVEATVPPTDQRDFIYRLDTKKAQIPDGRLTIEAVLYVDFPSGPRAVNRSSVAVRLDNAASIRIPSGGLQLRYGWSSGREWIYDVTSRTTLSFVNADPSQRRNRAAEIETEVERFRMLYAVDQVLGGGQALVRHMVLPLPGRDTVTLMTGDNLTPELWRHDQFQPVYQRLTNTGREIFGSFPIYYSWEGSVSGYQSFDLISVRPLPVLPTKGVRPGDSWQAPILIGTTSDSRDNQGFIDTVKLKNQGRATEAAQARGELVALEWEGGHPSAKIRVRSEFNRLASQNIPLNRYETEELVWFALDLRKPIRREMRTVVEIRGALPQGSGGGNQGGDGGGGGNLVRPGEGNQGGGGKLPGSDGRQIGPNESLRQDFPQTGGGDEGGFGGRGMGGRRGGARRGQQGGSGGAGEQVVRLTYTTSMRLVK